MIKADISSYNIYEYDVINPVNNIENDINFKLNCSNHRKTCDQFDWINIQNIESEEKRRIISILEQTQVFEYDYTGLITLLERIQDNKTVYFAGCYQTMLGIGNQEYNFYQYAFFLDLEQKRLYALDYEEDFLF